MRLVEGADGLEILAAWLLFVGLMAWLPVWAFISWGGHRQALGVSRPRSAVALALFAILTGLPIVLIAWLAARSAA
jgi:hypothetical protein